MKNKHKRLFKQVFKWWDYSFLLEAMHLWFEHAANMTDEHGCHLVHKQTAKKMRICQLLIERIKKDDYNDNVVLFPKVEHTVNLDFRSGNSLEKSFNDPENYYPDKETYQKYLVLNMRRSAKQKQRDLDYLCAIIKKHLFSFWD